MVEKTLNEYTEALHALYVSMMDYQEFILKYPVSREQYDSFLVYYELLKKWTPIHNLVQQETLCDFFNRHILDSLEVVPFLQKNESICDVGTGAGFPGIVLSIMGYKDITLVESSHKKCSFLREVISTLNLQAIVLNQRIESVAQPLKTVVCRAFAPIDRLITLVKAERFVLLKGPHYQKEIVQENVQLTAHPGRFSKMCTIIEIVPHIRDLV